MKVSIEQITEAVNSSYSMREASRKLNLSFNTFKTYATKFGLYKPNKGRKGMLKGKFKKCKVSLKEILEGKHPSYQSNKLRLRLLGELGWEHKCMCCQNTTWNGQPIPLELDHIDGVRDNHLESNLRLLCPNCHAQTETYCGKNIKR